MYSVRLTPAAKRNLDRLSDLIFRRVIQRIEALAENPRPVGCTKIVGSENVWRIRIGDFRVVYEIDDNRKIVWITIVGHRRDVYRN